MQPVMNLLQPYNDWTNEEIKVPLPAEEAESRPLLREEQKNAPVEPSTGRVGLYGVVGGLKLLVTPQFYFILFSFSFTVSVRTRSESGTKYCFFNNIAM